MAETTLNEKCLSISQIGLVLNDIAMTAKTIQRFALMLRNEEDTRDIEALTQSIETMAERIGLLADKTADECPGTLGACFGATVDDWMMPPMYHKQKATEAA
jgi:hypothetical protein